MPSVAGQTSSAHQPCPVNRGFPGINPVKVSPLVVALSCREGWVGAGGRMFLWSVWSPILVANDSWMGALCHRGALTKYGQARSLLVSQSGENAADPPPPPHCLLNSSLLPIVGEACQAHLLTWMSYSSRTIFSTHNLCNNHSLRLSSATQLVCAPPVIS